VKCSSIFCAEGAPRMLSQHSRRNEEPSVTAAQRDKNDYNKDDAMDIFGFIAVVFTGFTSCPGRPSSSERARQEICVSSSGQIRS
jgi:hypothetical protein